MEIPVIILCHRWNESSPSSPQRNWLGGGLKNKYYSLDQPSNFISFWKKGGDELFVYESVEKKALASVKPVLNVTCN